MHIPSCPTCQIQIIDFTTAYKQACIPNDNYDVNKWLFVPNNYTEFRYILGTKGKNPLICIGINPSTAKPDCLDNTLKSVERIAKSNGFDSFIMFNVYAQRATNPGDMDKELNLKLHQENMLAFRHILKTTRENGSVPCVWASWGNIITMRKYLPRCLEEMIEIGKEYGASWVSCGKISKLGHPHHPLYLKKDSPLDSFDIEKYLKLINN